jgi:hypothetical protein
MRTITIIQSLSEYGINELNQFLKGETNQTLQKVS